MNLHKVKTFRCYQAVKIGHEMINNFLAGDQHHRVSNSHEAFFTPTLSTMILKCKESGRERFIPLTNIQDFELFDQVIKKAIQPREEDSSEIKRSEEIIVTDISNPKDQPVEAQLTDKAQKKKASKKVSKATKKA